jgi:predicted CXXCH cytochrome family protein
LNFIFDEKPKLHPDDSSRANRQQYIDWKKSGHAREGVACWDCHYSHQKGNANKFQTKLPGSSLCRSCHLVENTGVHGIHSVNNCIGCHMPAVGKRAVKGDVHSHRFMVIPPAQTIKAGGQEKQPNSCNLCHYHKSDKPDELLDILKQVRISGKNRKRFD